MAFDRSAKPEWIASLADFCAVLADQLDLPTLASDTNRPVMEALDFDSVAMVELALLLEDMGAILPPDIGYYTVTLVDLYAMYRRALGQTGA